MKACPLCAEQIQETAILCRYCGARLTAHGWAPGSQQTAAPYAVAPTNGMAIASMVLGLLWMYWVGSILALIFGYIAKRQMRESPTPQQGAGMATAGIVLGWIGVAVLVLLVVVIGLTAAFAPSDELSLGLDLTSGLG